MNRGVLRAVAPEDFLALANHRQQQVVVQLIGQIIEAIADEGREPDAWDGPHLAAAIGYAFVGWRSAALTLALRAITEPELRGAPFEAPGDGGQVATLRTLRSAQEDLRQLSYRDR